MPERNGKHGKPSKTRGGTSTTTPGTSRSGRRRGKSASSPAGLPATATDRQLIGWYQAGDDQALEMLLDRYETPLFHFLVGILKNHHLAEDALQETWCQALQNLEKVNADHLRGWLFTVAYHQAMLTKRRQNGKLNSVAAPYQLVDPAPCPRTQAQEHEEMIRVQDLLDCLPAAQREVICQRIYEGKRFRDIADDLDCPVNTALARMHEGLKRLRRLWGADYV